MAAASSMKWREAQRTVAVLSKFFRHKVYEYRWFVRRIPDTGARQHEHRGWLLHARAQVRHVVPHNRPRHSRGGIVKVHSEPAALCSLHGCAELRVFVDIARLGGPDVLEKTAASGGTIQPIGLVELPSAVLERAVQSASLKHAPPPFRLMTKSDGLEPMRK